MKTGGPGGEPTPSGSGPLDPHARYSQAALIRALTIFAAAIFLGSELVACGGSSRGQDRVAACATGIASGALGPIAPGEKPDAELVNAAEALCRDADDEGALDSDGNIAADQAPALLRKHASSVLTPICDRIADATRAASSPEMLRYLTAEDFKKYADGACAVAGNYIRDDATLDVVRLFSEHPQLMNPFCVASIRSVAAKDPQSPIPKGRLDEFGRLLCRRMFQEDLVVVTGPGQFRLRRESPKYRHVLRQVLAEVVNG